MRWSWSTDADAGSNSPLGYTKAPEGHNICDKDCGETDACVPLYEGSLCSFRRQQHNFTILSNAPVKTGEMKLVLRSRLGFEETTLRDLKNALTVIKSRRGLEAVTLQDYKDATFVIKDC